MKRKFRFQHHGRPTTFHAENLATDLDIETAPPSALLFQEALTGTKHFVALDFQGQGVLARTLADAQHWLKEMYP